MAYTINEYAKGNNLSAEAERNAQRTVNFINDVIAAVGHKVRITSTVRTVAQNKAVGGVPNSKHLVSRALAVDFVPVNYSEVLTGKIRAVATKHGFGFLIHNVKTGKHIHCEFKGVEKKN